MKSNAQQAPRPAETGAVLMVTLLGILAMGLLAAALTSLVASTGQTRQIQQIGNQAFYMAESGARYAINRLRTDRIDALGELDGQTFTLDNGWGFDLKIDTTDTGATYIFSIDSTGFVSTSGGTQRQNVNGYQVEVPKYDDYVSLPTSFTFAIQTTSPDTTTLTGSSYVDSYDSAVADWIAEGAESDAVIRSVGTEDVLKLTGTSFVYGSISVPTDADTSDVSDLVSVPGYYTEGQIPVVTTADTEALTTIAVPAEDPEATMPISWDPVPSFATSGSSTISGGSYSTSDNFNIGSADLTVDDDLALEVGKDLDLGGSSLTVEGDLSAWIERDANLTSWGSGLTVEGDADLEVGRNFSITSSQSVVVEGDLDLDVAGDFSLSGDTSLYVKGDAYIDVGGSFSITGGAKLVVDGTVIIHVADGLSITSSLPIVLGENASVQIYVDSGDISFASVIINDSTTTDRFVVFGGDGVESVSISGDATVAGAIYTPSADFTITGSSQLFGAVVASSVTISGSSSIHYDAALSRVVPPIDLTEYPLRHYWVAAGSAE